MPCIPTYSPPGPTSTLARSWNPGTLCIKWDVGWLPKSELTYPILRRPLLALVSSGWSYGGLCRTLICRVNRRFRTMLKNYKDKRNRESVFLYGLDTLTFSRHRFACLEAIAFLILCESGYSMLWCGCTEGSLFFSNCSCTICTKCVMRSS